MDNDMERFGGIIYYGHNTQIKVCNMCLTSYPCQHDVIIRNKDDNDDNGNELKTRMTGLAILQWMQQHGVHNIPKHFLMYENNCEDGWYY